MAMKNSLIIFQKNPEHGKVKTRLAASVGNEKALSVYLKLIRHTKKVLDPLRADKQIWYSDKIDTNDIWDSVEYSKNVQNGSDLGKRMHNAFKNAFLKNDQQKVVVIGTDCAELTTEILDEAFEELDRNEVVIGPAVDGGYYLLGMKKFVSELFIDIPWSTSEVLGTTIARIQELGHTYLLLKELNDVDTIEDWEKAKGLI